MHHLTLDETRRRCDAGSAAGVSDDARSALASQRQVSVVLTRRGGRAGQQGTGEGEGAVEGEGEGEGEWPTRQWTDDAPGPPMQQQRTAPHGPRRVSHRRVGGMLYQPAHVSLICEVRSTMRGRGAYQPHTG